MSSIPMQSLGDQPRRGAPASTSRSIPRRPVASTPGSPRSTGTAAVAGADTFDPRTVASAPETDPGWPSHMLPVGTRGLAQPTILEPDDPRLQPDDPRLAAQALAGVTGTGSILGAGYANPEPVAGGTQRKRGCWNRRSTCAKWSIGVALVAGVGIAAAVGGIFAARSHSKNHGAATDNDVWPSDAGTHTVAPTTETGTLDLPTVTDTSALSTESDPIILPSVTEFATETDTSGPPGATAAGVLAPGSYTVTVSKNFDNCTMYDLPCGDDVLSGAWRFDQTSGGGYIYTGADGYKSVARARKTSAGEDALSFALVNEERFTWNDGGSTCTGRANSLGFVVPSAETAEIGRLVDLCGQQAGEFCLCWWKGTLT
jgi:hypothetical protein